MRTIRICTLVVVFSCMSLGEVEGNGDLTVSGATLTNDLAILALDCTANTNGGTLTTDENGIVICADDDGTTGPHTVDTNTQLSESEVDAFVANNGYSIGEHTVDTDTQLSESEVDAFVANNGYSTEPPIINQNSSAQSANWWTDGMMRMGTEAGTEQTAGKSIIVRNARSTILSEGSIVARSAALILERDGSNGGLRIQSLTTTTKSISCMGITSSNTLLAFNSTLNTIGTTTIFTNAQNVSHYDCSFGNYFLGRDHTRVTMTRVGTDSWWQGFIYSSFNQ